MLDIATKIVESLEIAKKSFVSEFLYHEKCFKNRQGKKFAFLYDLFSCINALNSFCHTHGAREHI